MGDTKVFEDTKRWLDECFIGIDPQFVPKYKINNLTEFREMVLEEIKKIPYGEVITYNDIAKVVAKKKNMNKMSA